MSHIIFGPVLSRRFGLSLGINLSPKSKQCNFDCLYCELKGAKTTDKMGDYPPVDGIIRELVIALERFEDIDVITITADGEPTLYPHLKELVTKINSIKNSKKLLILSNGSLVHNDKVKEALLDIDIVKFSLDSVLPKTFKKLDRPHPSVDLQSIINGMKEFRKIFKNELVIEVLVVKNLNDTRDDFMALNTIINEIKPQRVDISTIDRPSAYKVHSVDYDTMEILSREIKNIPVIIARRDGHVSMLLNLNEEEILQLLKLRPQSEQDIQNLLDKESQDRFKDLINLGKVRKISAVNIPFYELC